MKRAPQVRRCAGEMEDEDRSREAALQLENGKNPARLGTSPKVERTSKQRRRVEDEIMRDQESLRLGPEEELKGLFEKATVKAQGRRRYMIETGRGEIGLPPTYRAGTGAPTCSRAGKRERIMEDPEGESKKAASFS